MEMILFAGLNFSPAFSKIRFFTIILLSNKNFIF
jgi:hypothetical protein